MWVSIASVAESVVQQRAQDIEVRYLVVPTHSDNNTSTLRGPFGCGGGPAGAGCLGAGRYTRESALGVVIWDLDRRRVSKELSDTESTNDLVVGLMLPLWIPGGSSTKTRACHSVAHAVIGAMRETEAQRR